MFVVLLPTKRWNFIFSGEFGDNQPMLRAGLQIYSDIIQGMDFFLFEEGMDFITLEPPTEADISFIYTNTESLLNLYNKPLFTVVDCLETGIYPDGPVMTIKKVTIFIDTNR